MASCFYDYQNPVDNTLSRYDRLERKTNTEIAEAALEGFRAVLYRNDIPTPFEIASAYLQDRAYPLGEPLLLGMSLLMTDQPDGILSLPEKTRKAAIVFNYALYNQTNPDWFKHIINSCLELASDALSEFWEPQLQAGHENISGIHDLESMPEMTQIAATLSLSLLEKYPNCPISSLKRLLNAAFLHADNQALLELARKISNHPNTLGDMQRVLWYATVFILGTSEFAGRLRDLIDDDKERARAFVIHFVGDVFRRSNRYKILNVSHKDIGEIIDIAGRVLPPNDRDQQDEAGHYSIDHGADGVCSLIDRLGGDTDKNAGDILSELITRPHLQHWRDYLLHTFAIQQQNRREAIFNYPTVTCVIETLQNSTPANLPDLKALVLDHLKTLHKEFRDGSTDGYKNFWTVDSYGRPKDPAPEDYCRDRLLERLKPYLPQGVQAEPEGHFANDNRSDIKVLFNTMVMPVEIKRHYHPEVWTALVKQLSERYSRDPGADGHGIYLVIWFGINAKKVPTPPNKMTSPTTAADLEAALRSNIPDYLKSKIEVIVFDCESRKF